MTQTRYSLFSIAKNPSEILELIEYLSEDEKAELGSLLNLNRPELWYNDPVGFAYFGIGVKLLTKEQQDVLLSLKEHRYTIVRSANAVGKGFVGSIAGLWFYNRPQETKVILTAPPASNQRQLRLIWGEVVKHCTYFDRATNTMRYRRELLAGGQFHGMSLARSDRHFFRGYPIPLAGSPDVRKAKFSGEHAEWLMYLVDECDGVFSQYPEVFDGLDSCMSGGIARFLGLFNPRAQVGPIWELERSGKANVIELSAFTHPNVVYGPKGEDAEGNPIEYIPGAVTRQITIDRIVDWSKTANVEELRKINDDLRNNREVSKEFFQVPNFLDGQWSSNKREKLIGSTWRKVEKPSIYHMVLARYGVANERQLIPLEYVERAIERRKQYLDIHGTKPTEPRPRAGLDVADEGADFNSYVNRWGGYVDDFITWRGNNPNESAGIGFRYAIESNADVVFVDGIGVGAGVPNRMTELLQELNERKAQADEEEFFSIAFEKVMVSEKAIGAPVIDGVQQGRFRSLRDELIWLTMLWLRDDPTAMLPDDDDIRQEATAFEYYTLGSELVILPTKEIKKKIGRSPDKWASLALTFYGYRSFVVR